MANCCVAGKVSVCFVSFCHVLSGARLGVWRGRGEGGGYLAQGFANHLVPGWERIGCRRVLSSADEGVQQKKLTPRHIVSNTATRHLAWQVAGPENNGGQSAAWEPVGEAQPVHCCHGLYNRPTHACRKWLGGFAKLPLLRDGFHCGTMHQRKDCLDHLHVFKDRHESCSGTGAARVRDRCQAPASTLLPWSRNVQNGPRSRHCDVMLVALRVAFCVESDNYLGEGRKIEGGEDIDLRKVSSRSTNLQPREA